MPGASGRLQQRGCSGGAWRRAGAGRGTHKPRGTPRPPCCSCQAQPPPQERSPACSSPGQGLVVKPGQLLLGLAPAAHADRAQLMWPGRCAALAAPRFTPACRLCQRALGSMAAACRAGAALRGAVLKAGLRVQPAGTPGATWGRRLPFAHSTGVRAGRNGGLVGEKLARSCGNEKDRSMSFLMRSSRLAIVCLRFTRCSLSVWLAGARNGGRAAGAHAGGRAMPVDGAGRGRGQGRTGRHAQGGAGPAAVTANVVGPASRGPGAAVHRFPQRLQRVAKALLDMTAGYAQSIDR